ncbi:hypothetical protein CDD80_603 [Ophiocordyceps camponoti-rufipedis]|uniref:FAD-binding FR-type domain-containing protein n=1 Tax=Ophiocordyceps camponoti-rufipedis TaxID=2004952 RepID=A0A2C5ZDD0_9HYPO|nr:hypothetical protein CDD80_603 [Ophiocordyceps camponoti-rufipedis]
MKTTAEAGAESTILPYYTGLNGVDLTTNTLFAYLFWLTMGVLALAVLGIRLAERLKRRHGRGSTTQWRWTPSIKKHLLYAPLFSKRHNREFRPLPSLNWGTLPSRPYAIFLTVYLALNLAAMLVLRLNRGNPNGYAVLAELRGRSGTLAVANMVPLVVLAGRNNPLIRLLGISFDSYNMLHRWLGRLAIVQIVVHVACWMSVASADGGLRHAFAIASRSGGLFLTSGMAGAIAAVVLLLLSVAPLRHAFYETFLNLHILLALALLATTWIHCASADVDRGLPQLPWIMAIVFIWLVERMARVVRTVWLHWPRGIASLALCEALPGQLTRLTVQLPRYVDVKPGTHAFLRIWGVDFWQSHPFSIAWVHHHHLHGPSGRRLLGPYKSDRSDAVTLLTFLVRARDGATRKLLDKAGRDEKGVRLPVTVEGPYAGYHDLGSYRHLVLIAASTGITHQLSYVKPLLEGCNAVRRLLLCWIIRDREWIEWVRPFMDAISRIPGSEHVVSFQVFITRHHGTIVGDTAAMPLVRLCSGRPDVARLVEEEVSCAGGDMCVSVCGAGALADDVRGAVRAVQGCRVVVDFIEECFTW